MTNTMQGALVQKPHDLGVDDFIADTFQIVGESNDKGRLGVVFECVDKDDIKGPRYAAKLLKPEHMNNPAARAAFATQISNVNMLKKASEKPAILGIAEKPREHQGVPLIVMKWIDTSLDDFVKDYFSHTQGDPELIKEAAKKEEWIENALEIAYNILDVISTMHPKTGYGWDIKTRNIRLEKNEETGKMEVRMNDMWGRDDTLTSRDARFHPPVGDLDELLVLGKDGKTKGLPSDLYSWAHVTEYLLVGSVGHPQFTTLNPGISDMVWNLINAHRYHHNMRSFEDASKVMKKFAAAIEGKKPAAQGKLGPAQSPYSLERVDGYIRIVAANTTYVSSLNTEKIPGPKNLDTDTLETDILPIDLKKKHKSGAPGGIEYREKALKDFEDKTTAIGQRNLSPKQQQDVEDHTVAYATAEVSGIDAQIAQIDTSLTNLKVTKDKIEEKEKGYEAAKKQLQKTRDAFEQYIP